MSSLPPLATLEDVQARVPFTTSSAQEQITETLLVDASAKVRTYTGQTFTLVENDEQVLRPVGTLIRLPQRPVIEVASVVALGGGQLPDIPLSGWMWDGADLINVAGIDSNVFVSMPEWWNEHAGTNTYRVTYTHGYDEVPADVVAVVCGMVTRTLTSPSIAEGLVSERIGQYNFQMQQGVGSPGVSVRLTRADRDDLQRFRRTSSTIAVTAH